MKKPQVKKYKKKRTSLISSNRKLDHLKKKIKRLEKIDRNFLWHPFTQMQEWVQQKPTIIETAKGIYLKDLSGKKFLDGSSSIWVNLHGHRRKELDQAIKQQLNKVAHSTLLGLSNIPAIELAKELIHISPKGLKRVFYSDNGSTAIEIALKMAHQFWKLQNPSHANKNSFLSFTNAYHGDTIGSISLGGIPLFHQRFNPLLFKTFRVSSPYCYRCHLKLDFPSCNMVCTDEVEKIFEEHHHEIAAVVIEPKIQAAAGMLTAPRGYLKKIRQLCDQYQVLLIADEVATGFGRTGKMFACQEDQVTPDLLALSKGITGGYLPLAATLTTEKIYQAFLGSYEEFKTFYHGHSYTGNPIGCAVALASLKIFKKDHLLKVVRGKASFLKKLLIPMKNLPHVGDIRQTGLMVGIELVKNKATKEPYSLSEKIGMQICEEVRKRGMILRPLGNIIVLMPPLITQHQELSKMVQIIQDSIQAVTNPE